MSDDSFNPYVSPESISGKNVLPSRLVKRTLVVCVFLNLAMVVAQQFAVVQFRAWGIHLPTITRFFVSPSSIGWLFIALIPVWSSWTWKSDRRRKAVCFLVLGITVFWSVIFFFAMYVPIAAIRSGLGK